MIVLISEEKNYPRIVDPGNLDWEWDEVSTIRRVQNQTRKS